MEITHEQQGDVTVVRLAGRLDSGAAQSADAGLAALLGATEPRLVIDMSDLEYISSAGLRVLLVLARKVQQAKGKVALFGLLPNVREVFSISGFDTIFSLQPDPAAAIAAVR